jgi:hypothetical protein
MAHLHLVESKSEGLSAVRTALDHAQHLSESSDRRHSSAWAAAEHVGDLSALAMVALTEPDPIVA